MSANVIIKPVITEKSLQQAGKGWYTFQVEKKADKAGIKKGIEELFGVNVLVVRSLITKGKTRRVGKLRRERSLPAIKKALVKLAKDQKIDLFETGK